MSSADASGSVLLILRRADLHRRQRDWDAALLDYRRVAVIDPNDVGMMLGRTQLHLDRHEYAPALYWSARLLHQQPAHALAALLHARALAGAGDSELASIVFDRAVRTIDKPRPEHFLEQARITLAGKSDPDSRRRAIAIIDRGAEALAYPISLHSAAYELEVEAGDFAAALHRVDGILSRNSALLNWQLQRAELLIDMDRQSEARDELHCLTDRIQQLPQPRRSSRAVQSVLKRVRNLLNHPDLHHSKSRCDDR